MKICPICETENKPQATHCEVCGERLEAPGPNEEVTPEESVSAQLTAAPPEDTGGGFFVREDPPAEPDAAAEPDTAPPEPEAPTKPVLSNEQLEAEFAALLEKSKSDAPEPEAASPAPPPPVVTPAEIPAAPEAPAPPPKPAVSAEPRPRIVSSGIPEARIVIYVDRQPIHTHPIVNDETLIGRYDPVSGSYPEIDLTEFDPEARTSRKHAFIYRMGEDHYLYPVSNSGTQLGSELVEMGQKKKLEDGDIIILAATLAMKFHIDA